MALAMSALINETCTGLLADCETEQPTSTLLNCLNLLIRVAACELPLGY